jgi:hypothetical protein
MLRVLRANAERIKQGIIQHPESIMPVPVGLGSVWSVRDLEDGVYCIQVYLRICVITRSSCTTTNGGVGTDTGVIYSNNCRHYRMATSLTLFLKQLTIENLDLSELLLHVFGVVQKK